jgi:hypothetical protein
MGYIRQGKTGCAANGLQVGQLWESNFYSSISMVLLCFTAYKTSWGGGFLSHIWVNTVIHIAYLKTHSFYSDEEFILLENVWLKLDVWLQTLHIDSWKYWIQNLGLKEVNAENITIIYLSAVCLLLHLFIHSSMYLLFNFFLCYLFIYCQFNTNVSSSAHASCICMVSGYKSERMWQDMMTDWFEALL